jgi:hypothetical protein
VLGPNLYITGEAPLYHRGLLSKYEDSPGISSSFADLADSSLAMLVVLIGLYAAQVFYLMVLNKKHARTREGRGKKAVLVDKSMNRIKTKGGRR